MHAVNSAILGGTNDHMSAETFKGYSSAIVSFVKLLSVSPVIAYRVADMLTFFMSLTEERYKRVVCGCVAAAVFDGLYY